jgi:nucleotide-binding universal stress UspA family protein
MQLRDILVCLDATPAGEERLKLSLRLARAHHAAISGIYSVHDDAVEAVLFPPANEGEPGAAPVMSGTRAELAEQRFREQLSAQGLAGDWLLIDGAGTDAVIEFAKSADLAVLGQYERSGATRNTLRPEEVALASGRPVLILPYAGSFPTVGERALVAWDGTREASRALHDALPLIAEAENVTVVSVVGAENERERTQTSLDRVVRHLERHDIPARAETIVRGELGVSDILLSRASDLAADLIVAGAYHHSPYREALFGGVTRDLLDHMTVPVLMAH